jgi:hypothetical protein
MRLRDWLTCCCGIFVVDKREKNVAIYARPSIFSGHGGAKWKLLHARKHHIPTAPPGVPIHHDVACLLLPAVLK